jgi:hypothetical protein
MRSSALKVGKSTEIEQDNQHKALFDGHELFLPSLID